MANCTSCRRNFGLDGDVRTQLRARGIYEARLYHARLRIKADFDVPLRYGLGSDTGAYRFGCPFIAFGVTDIRGIESPLTATLDGAPAKLLPGSGTGLLREGLNLAAPSISPESAAHLQARSRSPSSGHE